MEFQRDLFGFSREFSSVQIQINQRFLTRNQPLSKPNTPPVAARCVRAMLLFPKHTPSLFSKKTSKRRNSSTNKLADRTFFTPPRIQEVSILSWRLTTKWCASSRSFHTSRCPAIALHSLRISSMLLYFCMICFLLCRTEAAIA